MDRFDIGLLLIRCRREISGEIQLKGLCDQTGHILTRFCGSNSHCINWLFCNITPRFYLSEIFTLNFHLNCHFLLSKQLWNFFYEVRFPFLEKFLLLCIESENFSGNYK